MSSTSPATPTPAIATHDGVPASGWMGAAVGPPLASLAFHVGLVLLTAHWWIDGSLPTRSHTLQLANVEREEPLQEEPLVVAAQTTQMAAAGGESSAPSANLQVASLSSIPAPRLPPRSAPAPVTPTSEVASLLDALPTDALTFGAGHSGGSSGGNGGRVAGDAEREDGVQAGEGAEFFGVAAGGRRFVFVVDSSRSMSGRRWVLACQELLKTVKSLNEDQSFYVIFFDQGANPMFTKDVQQDLLPATDANIVKLRRWISSISFGSDTRPALAMRLALALKPDAVFLLSDGEFRDQTRPMLRVVNRASGDADAADDSFVAPIHAIGFHSRAAGISLQPLAAENGGVYRFVPHPRNRARNKSAANQISQVRR